MDGKLKREQKEQKAERPLDRDQKRDEKQGSGGKDAPEHLFLSGIHG